MKIVTRVELDGLASSVLLSIVEKITGIHFVHPQDMLDNKVEVTDDDIIVNLPYVKGCGMWFDHHITEKNKLPGIGDFRGRFDLAPSTARVIHDHYKDPRFEKYAELLDAVDKYDGAQLTMEDVTDPQGWVLLGFTIDPRSNLTKDFQDYFRGLIDKIKEMPVGRLVECPEVKSRIDKLRAGQKEFKKALEEHAKRDGNVIVTDWRDVRPIPAGNRFLVFTLFPEANVEVRIFPHKESGLTVISVGHSIFNRTCGVNIGKLLMEFGGGGHRGAGTCQVPNEKTDEVLGKILPRLKQ